jgi:DNA polymerase (family 10)
VYNTKIAEMFSEIADMLELEGSERKFEFLAYRKAAMTIGLLQEDVGSIYKKEGIEGLLRLSGVGKTLAERIREYIETGRMSKYDKLKKKYPIDFANLTKLQGMGSKKAFKLYKALGVRDTEDLKKAIAAHKVRKVEGFGERTEAEMAKALGLMESSKGRVLLGIALPEAESIRDELLKSGLVEKAVICGSTRRMKETVGDLDMLLISGKGERVMDFVARMPQTASVVVKGPTKTTVMLKMGITCDFRLVERESFGAAVQYFTGNKDHNIRLREIAIRKGYKLNEYGLFDKRNRNLVKGESEEAVYERLGMDCMEPEMRENRGEIDLAIRHKLPRLVQLVDLAGDLHVHSSHSHGANTIAEMAEAAIGMKMSYIGMTDHSKSEYVSNGMDDRAFEKYFAEIDRINSKLDGRLKLLKSGEVDILKDGTLDLKDRTLDHMDYVLASVHTSLGLPKDEMTKRFVKALSSGRVDILGHPTCRLINQREPAALDLDKVFEAAKDANVVMEVDSPIDRLDLNDENIIRARKYGLKFSIASDAHMASHLEFIRYGVSMAKRGWLTKGDVINTMGLKDLLKFFKR